MTLKPGSEITTVEQLKTLPKGAILKIKDKEKGRIDAGLVRMPSFRGNSIPIVETVDTVWGMVDWGNFVEKCTITVLDIPEREWKVGDTVETWEQTRELPEYTVLASISHTSAVWLKHHAPENEWESTNTNVWADEEDPINRVYFPMRILRLGTE